MNPFKDGQYLDAEAKLRVFKAWERFLKSDLKPTVFTDAVYKQLSLHWGFIAHYDRAGFHYARFAMPDGLRATLRQMMEPSKWVFVDENCSGNADLHRAMHEVLKAHAERLNKLADDREADVLEQRIKYAGQRLAQIRGGSK